MKKTNCMLKRAWVLTLCAMLLCLLLPVTSFADHDFAVFSVKVCDANGNGLAGAEFGLYQGENLKLEQATDMNGRALFNAELGEYKLKQITAPSGYVKSDATYDIVVYFDESIQDHKAYIDNGPGKDPTPIDRNRAIQFVNLADPVLSFHVYKQVNLGGDIAPGKQRFTFELPNINSENVTVAGNTIETNGAGAYSTVMEITVPGAQFSNLVAEGFTVKEKIDNASG